MHERLLLFNAEQAWLVRVVYGDMMCVRLCITYMQRCHPLLQFPIRLPVRLHLACPGCALKEHSGH
jgi:hypothetical protein